MILSFAMQPENASPPTRFRNLRGALALIGLETSKGVRS